MRRVLVTILGLACSLSIADENENQNERENAREYDELAVETVEMGPDSARAEAARAALTALLEGVDATAGEDGSDMGASNTGDGKRVERVRADELSSAHIPHAAMPSQARQKFTDLRDKLFNARDIVVVANELQDFVNAHPTHREARLAMGRLQILMDQPSAALGTFAPLLSTVAEKNHPDWQPWFWAGTAYLATGRIDEARHSLDVAVAKDSGVVDIWVQLAVLEQEDGNHAGALQYVSIAEQIDPGASAIYLNRAYSLERLGRFEEAMLAYQRFLVSDINASSRSIRPSIMRRIATISAAVEADSAANAYLKRG